MCKNKIYLLTILLNFVLIAPLFSQDNSELSASKWKGNAILGNGNLCAVYSDNGQIIEQTQTAGIQHLYFGNYTVDYVNGAYFQVLDQDNNSYENEIVADETTLGMKNFCTTQSIYTYTNGIKTETNCMVNAADAVIMTFTPKASFPDNFSQEFLLSLRKKFVSSQTTSLTKLSVDGNMAVAQWSNGTVMVVAPHKTGQTITAKDSTISISGKVKLNEQVEIIMAFATDIKVAKANLKQLQSERLLFESTFDYWDKWLNSGKLPAFAQTDKQLELYTDLYNRNLYAAKSACINGMLPADMTGQFVTNNLPQLYPRDAMMVARVFILTGHFAEASQIIKYWASASIPKKSKGEFYARYDAYGKAVDAGTGAKFNEPEWDASGYFIQLNNMYFRQKAEWLVSKEVIYEHADFLANSLNDFGLLFEGGIVEWTGYLPSTNMICAAALKTANDIAKTNTDKANADKYKAAYRGIQSNLTKLYDKSRNTYCAMRFSGEKDGNVSKTEQTGDTLFLWDTSTLFGALWGYNDHRELKSSYQFYKEHGTNDGGIRYFEAPGENGLSAYGMDVFFFTTAAAAQYQALISERNGAQRHLNWLVRNSNTYGLMLERIMADNITCSDASPLSWCCAEFVAAVLLFSQIK